MTEAIVLTSGGIDSAVCLGIACNQFHVIHPIHYDYGQQTSEVEKRMAYDQCVNMAEEYPDVEINKSAVINYKPVFGHFADGVADPAKDFSHMVEDDGRSSGYVPMRNLHLLATAAAIADQRGSRAIYIGVQHGDDDDYPDCRPEFMDAAQKAIVLSMADKDYLDIRTPLINDEKSDVIGRGFEVGVDFGATYSCYSAPEDPDNPVPCNQCPACVERADAFAHVPQVEDPFASGVKDD